MGIRDMLVETRNKVIGISHLSFRIIEMSREIQEIRKGQQNVLKLLNKLEKESVVHVCPICLSSAKRFNPFGETHRPNAQCPTCGSVERHRLFWLFLNNETDIFKREIKMLHFAPEQCFQRRLVNCKNIDYISADLYSPHADVKVDIQDLPFDDESFDYIICVHVLEHIPDDIQAIREIHRVLKKDGCAFIIVPIQFSVPRTFEDENIRTPEERARQFGQSDHLRLYGLDFKDRLEQANFVVQSEDYARQLDPGVRDVFRLPPKEFIYSCSKTCHLKIPPSP